MSDQLTCYRLTCYSCDRVIEESDPYREHDGNTYCQDCFDDNFSYCESCSHIIPSDDAHDYHGVVVCQSCHDEHFQVCECCGKSYDCDYETCHGSAWGSMCEACSDEHFECGRCGEVHSTDDYGEDGCCQDCSCSSTDIHDYGYKPGPLFHPANPNYHHAALPHTLYMGVELETDRYKDAGEAAQALNKLDPDEQLFYLKEDSSLTCGIEIVTHPCTLSYHLQKFPWEQIIKMATQYGGRSHDTNTCGLHVHFNQDFFGDDNKRDVAILRLLYLVEKYWDWILAFSRRDLVSAQRWASRYTQVFDKLPLQDFKHNKRNYMWHHAAINITDDTIEVRIFRGTLQLNTLFAAFELVAFLARLVKRKSIHALYQMTLADLLHEIGEKSYPHLNAYITERNLAQLDMFTKLDNGEPPRRLLLKHKQPKTPKAIRAQLRNLQLLCDHINISDAERGHVVRDEADCLICNACCATSRRNEIIYDGGHYVPNPNQTS